VLFEVLLCFSEYRLSLLQEDIEFWLVDYGSM